MNSKWSLIIPTKNESDLGERLLFLDVPLKKSLEPLPARYRDTLAAFIQEDVYFKCALRDLIDLFRIKCWDILEACLRRDPW